MKITQQMLADSLGITARSISRIFTGKATPSLKLATMLEKMTGVPCTAWLDRTAPKWAQIRKTLQSSQKEPTD